jgi:hypothetical protein
VLANSWEEEAVWVNATSDGEWVIVVSEWVIVVSDSSEWVSDSSEW